MLSDLTPWCLLFSSLLCGLPFGAPLVSGVCFFVVGPAGCLAFAELSLMRINIIK